MERKNLELSARLSACAAFVRKNSRVADIGTDHALLPVWLMLNSAARSAVASDINEGPIERARENIEKYGLSDSINTVVADGLAGIAPNSADDIIIAGMGGELIACILQAAPWVKNENTRLILQPMSKPEKLRRWLCENGFDIMEEQAIFDAGKYYTVMCVQYIETPRQYGEEFMHGGRLLGKSDEVSVEYLRRRAASLRKEAGGAQCEGNTELAERLNKIADALEQSKNA